MGVVKLNLTGESSTFIVKLWVDEGLFSGYFLSIV